MEKLKVYKLTIGGSTLYDQIIQNLLDTLEVEIQQMDEEGIDAELSFEMMTQEQYEALPEFDGW